MDIPLIEKFGNRVRLRVSGLVLRGEEILMINHKGLYPHDFWAPPGGGVEFGESAINALKREFKEECRCEIEGAEFRFACELVKPPLHAIELFFEVKLLGTPRLGHDPEIQGNQMLSEVRFIGFEDLKAMPSHYLHGIFKMAKNLPAIRQLNGFFTLN